MNKKRNQANRSIKAVNQHLGGLLTDYQSICRQAGPSQQQQDPHKIGASAVWTVILQNDRLQLTRLPMGQKTQNKIIMVYKQAAWSRQSNVQFEAHPLEIGWLVKQAMQMHR